ncbi:MAG: hypothetical protein K8R53_08485 [Bacteroidales bacterium]|nr:hypothetical protein [Bacteroidales bacterium]
MKISRFIYLLIVISVERFGQNGSNPYGFWNQKSLTGALGFKAHYRNQHQVLGSGFEENTQGALISGGLLLESRSFIVHPNLMALDIDVEYNPEKLDEKFLVIPDRSEVRTLKRLNVRTTFFQEKDISLNAFVNLNQNYINRENFTNSRTNRKFWGGGLFYKNSILPFSVTYQEGNWDQTEIETGRTYSYWQRNIIGKISKSFSSFDKHDLTLSHDEYIRKEFNINPRKNQVNYAGLNSNFYFDSKKNYTLNTIVSNFNQIGADNLNRFQVFANMILKLPHNFRIVGNYNFFTNQYPLYRLDQNRFKFDLGHQLFKSLKTNLFVEYSNNKHTVYQDSDTRAGFNINYTKKIPRGQLNISYMFYNRDYKRNSDPVSLKVMNEEHILSDNEIILLEKPYVETETVVVKDITGTIIYQLNYDYILLEQNNYTEIKRIPGGQIANNSTIFIDYRTLLPGAYKYNLNNQHFSASVILFKQLVELYYRWGKQDYNYIEQTDLVPLNYYLQNVYGVQFTIGFARFGVEYDDYKSSIIPYQLVRYFANLQWSFKNKLILSLVGNVRDYITIGNRKNEFYADVSGRVAYRFNTRTKLNLELGYRDQKGYAIDLDLFTARTEFTIIVRKVYFTAGLEAYRRNYLNREKINFNGAYLSIVRKF